MLEYFEISDFFEKYIKWEKEKSRIYKNFYMDFHLHTHVSDGLNDVRFLEGFLEDKTHMLSITDHNGIASNILAHERGNLNIVPGIELGCKDGFEILVYFKRPEDLEEFYKKSVEKYRNKYRMIKTSRGVEEYFEDLKAYESFISIPHINGLAHKNYLKYIPYVEDILERVDAIESYNHTLPKKRNLVAKKIRKKYDLFATFGSDGHTNGEIKSFYKFQNEDSTEYKSGRNFMTSSFSAMAILSKHCQHIWKKSMGK